MVEASSTTTMDWTSLRWFMDWQLSEFIRHSRHRIY
jgi:hypothetical protein